MSIGERNNADQQLISPDQSSPERVPSGGRLRRRRPSGPPADQAAPAQPTQASTTSFLRVDLHNGSSEDGTVFELRQPNITLGSDSHNDIVIPSPVIPPHFAVIERSQSGRPRIIVRDPRAPLFFRGEPVRERILASGDTLRVGSPNGSMVTLRYDEHAAGTQARHTAFGRHIPLSSSEPLLIGRASDNQIVIEHESVAPHHARIWRDVDGEFQLTDLSRTSATYLNGRPIDSAVLVPGAEVRIGPNRYIFTGSELTQYDETTEIRIDAVDLRQTVRVGGLGPIGGKRKVLLDGVSLTILPGTFVAIVGASGAGKTTLLNALSGQHAPDEGHVLYNGDDLYAHRDQYKRQLAVVPQDDIIHKNLTVERALYYAARLRLPPSASRSETRDRVREVLEDVDMLPQRGQSIMKLSGGQRKRVNIALELLARPSIFFLDEPSAGIDPGLDRKLMELLRRLADRGKTVVLVTHATDNINVCDFVCFMAPGGRIAYYGTPAELTRHFGTSDHAEIYNEIDADPDRWVQIFRQSPDYLKYVEAPRAQSLSRTLAPEERRTAQANEPGRNAFGQFLLLTRRYVDLMIHDKMNLLILLIQAPIIALLIILLARNHTFSDVAHPPAGNLGYDILAQRTAFILVCSALWFGTINAAREIVKEAPVYRRERAVGMSVGAYIFSKIVVLGALCIVQDVILLYIVGLKSGYPANGLIWPGRSGAFAEIYISLLLTGLAGLMLGLAISAFAPNTDRAVSFVPILLIPQIIFANVIFTISGIWGKIISFTMPSRWGMQAVGSIIGIRDRFSDHLHEPFYAANVSHLIGFWLALLLLSAVFCGLALIMQLRKDAA